MKPHPYLAGKQMLFYILSYLPILFILVWSFLGNWVLYKSNPLCFYTFLF